MSYNYQDKVSNHDPIQAGSTITWAIMSQGTPTAPNAFGYDEKKNLLLYKDRLSRLAERIVEMIRDKEEVDKIFLQDVPAADPEKKMFLGLLTEKLGTLEGKNWKIAESVGQSVDQLHGEPNHGLLTLYDSSKLDIDTGKTTAARTTIARDTSNDHQAGRSQAFVFNNRITKESILAVNVKHTDTNNVVEHNSDYAHYTTVKNNATVAATNLILAGDFQCGVTELNNAPKYSHQPSSALRDQEGNFSFTNQVAIITDEPNLPKHAQSLKAYNRRVNVQYSDSASYQPEDYNKVMEDTGIAHMTFTGKQQTQPTKIDDTTKAVWFDAIDDATLSSDSDYILKQVFLYLVNLKRANPTTTALADLIPEKLRMAMGYQVGEQMAVLTIEAKGDGGTFQATAAALAKLIPDLPNEVNIEEIFTADKDAIKKNVNNLFANNGVTATLVESTESSLLTDERRNHIETELKGPFEGKLKETTDKKLLHQADDPIKTDTPQNTGVIALEHAKHFLNEGKLHEAIAKDSDRLEWIKRKRKEQQQNCHAASTLLPPQTTLTQDPKDTKGFKGAAKPLTFAQGKKFCEDHPGYDIKKDEKGNGFTISLPQDSHSNTRENFQVNDKKITLSSEASDSAVKAALEFLKAQSVTSIKITAVSQAAFDQIKTLAIGMGINVDADSSVKPKESQEAKQSPTNPFAGMPGYGP